MKKTISYHILVTLAMAIAFLFIGLSFRDLKDKNKQQRKEEVADSINIMLVNDLASLDKISYQLLLGKTYQADSLTRALIKEKLHSLVKRNY